MSRVKTVAKAQKDQGQCGRCWTPLVAGQPYRWTKTSRFSSRKVRCMASACNFRPSDLTANDKLATLYAAQETAEDALAGWTADQGHEGLQSIVDDLKSAVDDVAQEFRDAQESVEDGFGHSTQTSDELGEKADELEGWSSDLESITIEEKPTEVEDAESCEDCNGLGVVDSESGDAFTDQVQADKASAKDKTVDCDNCNGSGEEDNSDDIDDEVATWADEARSEVEEAIGGCPL